MLPPLFFAGREAVLLKRRFILLTCDDYDNHVRVYGILDAMVLMIIKGCLSFKCLQPLVSNKDCSGVYVYDEVNDFSEFALHHSRPGLT